MENLLGKFILDRYQIEEVIGEGGFGTAYIALDTKRNKKVAIKQNSFSDDVHPAMLEKEANILATLSHPNLPLVYDYCYYKDENLNCLIIDFIEGENLGHTILKEGYHYSEKQIYSWIIQVCDAISYMHNHKPPLLHLDIKPENIMVREDVAMLIDFGFCAVYDPANNLFPSAWAMSFRYASPEHLNYGKKGLDTRSDIYSLGATTYTALTRQYVPSVVERIYNNKIIISPRQYNLNISTQIEAAILKALQLEPELRFASVDEFRLVFTLEMAE